MKKTLYNTNRHSCYLLQYHLVVVTKYRKPVITGELKTFLIQKTIELFEQQWKCKVISINTDVDHIHILFETMPQVQLSTLINNYKTVTSRLIRKNFAQQLAPYYWKPYFWSLSYFICTVSEKNEAVVKNYIESQGKANHA